MAGEIARDERMLQRPAKHRVVEAAAAADPRMNGQARLPNRQPGD